MSQVIRKFENSGKIEQSKPELFERSGVGKYNKADLVAGLYRNIDTYIKNNNLSGDKAVSFRNSANQFIKGIESGSITMNGDGTFSDATGSMASTGKFDKNWIGRKKDTANNAFNLVGDYALDYINQMQQYTEPAAKPKSKFNTNDFLTKEISKRWYGGNNIDYNNWFKNRTEQERNTLFGEIFNNADYNQLYQDYDWTDTGINSAEDLANRGRGFSTAISNNKLDNDDYNTFAALGGTGLDKFMKYVPEPTPEQSRMKAWEAEAEAAGATTPEAKAAFIQMKQREEADRNAAIIKANDEDIYNRERDKFFNDFSSQNPFKGTINGYVSSKTSYNPEQMLQYVDTAYKGNITDYLKSALDPRYFRGQLSHTDANGQDNLREHLANNLDLAINAGKLPKIDDETYAIPGTYNYDNWSLITYNPVSRQYKETSMLANDALKKIAYGGYDRRKKTPSNKEGGIIKLQYGGFVEDDSAYNAYRQQFAKKKEEKKQQVEAKAKATGRTVKQVEEGERKPMADNQEWEWDDYTRLGAAGADVASIIASFAPGYGTVASAGLGVGSTLANFTADMKDGFQWGDLGNLGLGLGMDAVGLIPGFGAAGKGSKILKNLLKVAPKLMTTWSVYTSFAPAMQAFTKLRDKGAKEMTVDDWKALANGLTAAAGATRWGASAVRNKRLTNQYGLPYRTVTTKSGKQVSMSEDQFQQMKRATGIEEQNKVLQSVAEGEELPTTFKKWYSLKRLTQGTPSTSKGIDFSTMDLRRVTSDGKVLEPHPLSNEGIWKYMVNNSWGKSFKRPDIGKSDPQGRLKFNAGGVVQFLQDGKTVGRIKAKGMSNWNRAQALTSYDWGADFDRWASSHDSPDDVVDSYITSFNGGEDIYDQLTSKTGDYFGGKYNYSVQDPLAKHRQVTFRGTNQGFDDLIRKGIVGYGTTEGDSGFDIYAGDRTGNRTLGRGLSAEDVTRFNKQLQSRGMELYDKGNGAYRLRRFERKPVELPEVVVTANAPTNPTAVTPAASKKGKGFNLGVMPEDVIALGRMVGGLAANNRAAKLYKEGLKPTLLDTFENTVPLQGNFQAKTNAEQQAGNLESVAARPRTSDASLQLAGELEASDRAGQARFQGGLQDAEMFYKTRMLGQQESDAAKGRRVEVANRNRASMNQIDAAKKQIDAARITSNYQNVIAPYLAGVENQFAQKRAMNQQLDMEEAQRLAERTYSPEFDRLTEDYNTAYKAYGDANKNDYTGWQTSNEYKSLLNRRKTLNDNVSQFLLDKRRGIMGSPYMFQFKGSSSTKTPYVKSGGKLSAADREKLQRARDFNKRLLEDNKQFHKDIMESKREHNKLIMSMSSLTSELIKKAMS